MSLDTQVALARPIARGESSHLSRTARQIVPPFLQKLYEIVNDPANEELIKWSDNGDSFYVLNHERFAREVLGRWFKHQKFASFVRQLNMYGFHKIPHLQQGVLKSDSDTEPWHFEHPNFRRAQPDLLCLIQRKKQPNHGQADEPPVLDIQDAAAAQPANISSGQLLDINSIVNGVSAIKRHQQAISSDLSALKQSNDALWKEAVAARQRHVKHQDTINRILKFLAGVFGPGEGDGHSPDGTHTPPQVTPRIRPRLMIGHRVPKPVGIVEVEDDEADILSRKRAASYDRPFASIATPETTVTTPSIIESAPLSPRTENGSDAGRSPALRPSQILSRASSTSSAPRLTDSTTPSSLPTLPSIPNGQNIPENIMWQAALQHLMNSPGQFQRLVQAFANQQSLPGLSPPTDSPAPSAAHTITSYDPNQTDYARWITPPPSVPSPSPSTASQPLVVPTSMDESPPLQLLLDESSRLQKSYQDASEIDADMDLLQSSINSFIQNLGIDPATLPTSDDPVSPSTPIASSLSAAHANASANTNGFPGPLPPDAFSAASSAMGGLDLNGTEPVPDYLLDSLLSQIGDGHSGTGANGAGLAYPDITDHYDPSARIDGTALEDASTEQLAAFLDEASASADGRGSPTATRSPRVVMNGAGGGGHAKRKSDLVDHPLPTPPAEETGRKVKRKR